MNKQQFGDFIAENRKAAGLTQKALAEQLHVTDKAVSKWERALSYPDVTLLEPLAEALSMGVEELMSCQRREEKKEEQPVQNLLEISRESLRKERRKNAWRIVAAAVTVLVVTLAAVWYIGSFVSETRESIIVLKETVGEDDCIYVQENGHLIRLKCGDGVDFDRISPTNEWGDKLTYRMDCRWNRRTYQGTVTSCEVTGGFVLGGLMDVTYEVEEKPLFHYPAVHYQDESRYPDPYAEPRGRVFLSDFRFWTGTWNSEAVQWDDEKTILKEEDCLNIWIDDVDHDGQNELVVRTRWPEKPYKIYDEEDGEIVTLWPETVPEEIQEKLLCIWEQ